MKSAPRSSKNLTVMFLKRSHLWTSSHPRQINVGASSYIVASCSDQRSPKIMALSEKALAFSIDSLLQEDGGRKEEYISSTLKQCGIDDGLDAVYFSRHWNNNSDSIINIINNNSTDSSVCLGKRNKEERDIQQRRDSQNAFGDIEIERRLSATLCVDPLSSGDSQHKLPHESTDQKEIGGSHAIPAVDGDCPRSLEHQTNHSMNLSATKNGITVSLEEPELWTEFHKCGTEMILNRAGRRMFPCVVASVTGLDPTALYSFKMEICPTDGNRYKFINNKWLPVGKADPALANTPFVHPDSPAFGAFWMKTKVSFAKIKITNNKDNLGTHTVLHSMHKYTPVIMIKKEKPIQSAEDSETLCFDFEKASFIAVTAYQNEQVTQLKIQNNPFAKAFRDADVTAILQGAYMLTGSPLGAYQAIYGNNVFPMNGETLVENTKTAAEMCPKRAKKYSHVDATRRHYLAERRRLSRCFGNRSASSSILEDLSSAQYADKSSYFGGSSVSSPDVRCNYTGEWGTHHHDVRTPFLRYPSSRSRPYHPATVRHAASTSALDKTYPLQIPKYAGGHLPKTSGSMYSYPSIDELRVDGSVSARTAACSTVSSSACHPMRSWSCSAVAMASQWEDDKSLPLSASTEFRTAAEVSRNLEEDETNEPMDLAIHKDTAP